MCLFGRRGFEWERWRIGVMEQWSVGILLIHQHTAFYIQFI